IALWQLGVATPGRKVPGGTQLALPLDLPAPPRLRQLSPWDSLIADYGTTGLTVGSHPMALLRDRLPPLGPAAHSASGLAGADGARAIPLVTSRDLQTLEHGSRVRVGGLVVARQRPGTAGGIV